jgi:dihydroxyacetone kinase-like protein
MSMTIDGIQAWLRLAAERLHEQRVTLTELDQAIGDGDHGFNMDRGFTQIVARLDEGVAADASPTIVLRLAGKTLISTVGGASGPLYGTAFLRAATALDGTAELEASHLFAALDAAVTGIGSLGKAVAGEKTMLDALIPATEAARDALTAGLDGSGVADAAAAAAEAGALATGPMLATKGRASYLGERSIGHQDPGATSAALLLRALADTLAGGSGSSAVSARSAAAR